MSEEIKNILKMAPIDNAQILTQLKNLQMLINIAIGAIDINHRQIHKIKNINDGNVLKYNVEMSFCPYSFVILHNMRMIEPSHQLDLPLFILLSHFKRDQIWKSQIGIKYEMQTR